MSCGCNNSYYNLPCCCPQGPTTTTTTTLCPDAIPCEESYQSDCIIYNGPDITCYGIKTGDSVTDILNIIISQLNPCTTTTTSTTTTSTTTTSTTSTTTTTTEAPTTTTTTTAVPCIINSYAFDISGEFPITYEICGQVVNATLTTGYQEICYSNLISLDPSVLPSLIGPCPTNGGSITFNVVNNSDGVITSFDPPVYILNSGNSFPVANNGSAVGTLSGTFSGQFLINYDSPTLTPVFKIYINSVLIDTVNGTIGTSQTFRYPNPVAAWAGFSITDNVIIEMSGTYISTGLFEVRNNHAIGTISSFSINGGYTASSGSLPLSPGQSLIGTHPAYAIGDLGQIVIDDGGSISLYKNGVLIECINIPLVSGIFTVSFTPLTVDYTINDDFLIIYDSIACATTTTSTTSTTTLAPTTSTSTTTLAPTTSTTTSSPGNKSDIIVDNFTSAASITNIIVNGVDQLQLLQNYPVGPTSGSQGPYNNGTISVTVFLSGVTSADVVTLIDSTGAVQCQSLVLNQTNVTFTNKTLNDTLGNIFQISLKQGPC
jgi:hypothetical protein